MILIIGSQALNFNREPSDIDIIARYDDAIRFAKLRGKIISCVPTENGNKLVVHYDGKTPLEVDIAWSGSSSNDLLELYEERYQGNEVAYADADTLYMLKMSHRYRKNSSHFLKTMADIHYLRKDNKVTKEIAPHLVKIYDKRVVETYNYGHPKLAVTKENFFKDDNINYLVDHDTIHEFVKLKDKPAYTKFSTPGEQVLSSKDRFFNEVTQEERLDAVWEESVVLAIERSLLPHPGVLTPQAAFLYALEKVCTSITSGWFREFAWEHYYEVSKRNSPDLNTILITNGENKCRQLLK
jgi:hypothetical protein